jgi:spermidine/putrescine transport system permease protein
MSVKIYNSAHSSRTPALNALATIMLVSSLVAIALGFLVYRRLTRGERSSESTVEGFAAQM